MTAQTVGTSSNALATSYTPSILVAMASNGDVFVLWFDGTNVKYSYASSPYTSWTTTTLVASIGAGPRWQAGLYHNTSDDSIVVVTSINGGNMVSYMFTYSSGAWTPGSQHTVLASSSSFNGGTVPMCKDAQGRIWCAYANNSNVIQVRWSSDSGATWNASTTFTQVGGGADNVIGMDYVGNYVVCCYMDSSASYVYQRIDASGASLGAWSTKASIGASADNTATSAGFRAVPGGDYAVLAHDEGNIPALYYQSTTNTWSSEATRGSANDKHVTVASDGTDLYIIWCKFSAANNFSLVYKKFTVSTQTWDSTATQLEANGSNLQWPNAAFAGTNLAFIYTVGTANPWTVKLDTLSFGGGTTTLTRTVPSSVVALATSARTVPTSAVALATSARTVPTSVATLATSARTVPTSVVASGGSIRTVPTSVVALQTAQRTVPSSVVALQPAARTVPSSLAALAIRTRTVPSSAVTLKTNVRTVLGSVVALATNARTVPTSLVASGGNNIRSVPTSVVALATSVRIVPTAAVAWTPNVVRSVPTSLAAGVTSMRTVPGSVVTLETSARLVPASVVAKATLARLIATSIAVIALGMQRTVPTSVVANAPGTVLPGSVGLADSLTNTVSTIDTPHGTVGTSDAPLGSVGLKDYIP